MKEHLHQRSETVLAHAVWASAFAIGLLTTGCFRSGFTTKEGCEDGEQRHCYSGPAGSEGVGTCHGGTRHCVDGGWSACEDEEVPVPEICDRLDNDCNDVVDDAQPERCYTGPPGSAGVGACREGFRACVDGAPTECAGEVTPRMLCSDAACGDLRCGVPCNPCPEGRLCDTTGGCAADPEARVFVPAGTFAMGSDSFRQSRPVHEVTISRSFLIDRFEVTAGRYRACVEESRCTPIGGGGAECSYPNDRWDHPMNCITWERAQRFCEQHGGRLPTEAEWEYAARGTDERPFPWGDTEPSCERAWFWDCYASYDLGETAPVGLRPGGASPFGAEDLAGNVWEWVIDWFGADAYAACADGCADPEGPTGPPENTERGCRGGGQFASDVRDPMIYPRSALRADGRDSAAPAASYVDIGFRCVYPAD